MSTLVQAELASIRCVECGPASLNERRKRTTHGCKRFNCCQYGKQFNERSDTKLDRVQHLSSVVAPVVLWRLRCKLSLRDLLEMFARRGRVFSYEALQAWRAKLTPATEAAELGSRHRGKADRDWYVDRNYRRMGGRWCYLYRAIDKTGALVDVLFSEQRDTKAAKLSLAWGGLDAAMEGRHLVWPPELISYEHPAG